ncbi:MAG: DUF2007 domain-containing protein [Cryomorphaceae bacterium]|nr:DUF2007 domain-containing protein [Flavobacteriales bacterium]
MRELITIATFTLPGELAIVKGRLESEGIDCFVKDELTVQVYNFVSNAVGGIKLQVRQDQALRAREILREMGYGAKEASEPSRFWTFFDDKTRHIPMLKSKRPEERLHILIWAILAVPVLVVVVSFIALLTL